MTRLLIGGESDGRWVGPLGRVARGQLQRPFVKQAIASFTVAPSAGDLSDLAELAEAAA